MCHRTPGTLSSNVAGASHGLKFQVRLKDGFAWERSLWDTLAGFAESRSLERSGFALYGGEHGRDELKDSDQISEDSTRKNLGCCYRGGFLFDFSYLMRLDGTEEWRALIEIPRPRYACILSLTSRREDRRLLHAPSLLSSKLGR